MLGIAFACLRAAVLLSEHPRGTSRSAASVLSSELLLEDGVRVAQSLALYLGELDVARPAADGADGDPNASGDHAQGETFLTP
jgi:hypothetical protein